MQELTEAAGGFVVGIVRGRLRGVGCGRVRDRGIGRVRVRMEGRDEGEDGEETGAESGEETPERGQRRGGSVLQSDCNKGVNGSSWQGIFECAPRIACIPKLLAAFSSRI